MERLQVIAQHTLACGASIQPTPCSAAAAPLSFMSEERGLAEALVGVLDPSYSLKKPMIAFMVERKKLYCTEADAYGLPLAEERALMHQRLQEFCRAGFIRVEDAIEDPMKFIAAHEALGIVDGALVYCFSVHMNLFGGSALKLGTEKHRNLFPMVSNMDGVRGCFALTELAHGAASGASIDTEAVFSRDTGKILLRTPNWEAQKGWVSFGANHASHAVVWADLICDDKRRGPHLFVVPLRDFQTMQLKPGVAISDRGMKSCLNGNDNGMFVFDNVELPKDALLDRFTRIDEEGNYSTDIPKPQELFNKFTDALLSGRLVVATCVLMLMKPALLIATRYGSTRTVRQRKGDPLPLWSFASHRRMLVPRIAESYACILTTNLMKKKFAEHAGRHFRSDGSLKTTPEEYTEDTEDLSLAICAMKAHNCLQTLKTIDIARACTGGQGVLAGNRLGEYNNVAVTLSCAEGDTVLLQQKTSRSLLGLLLAGKAPQPGDAAVLAKQFSLDSLPERLAAIEGFLHLRMAQLLQGLGQKVMAARAEGLETMAAWNTRCLPTAQLLHEAYCQHLVFAEFRVACSVPGVTAEVLQKLCLVQGLQTLEQQMGWFLGNVEELDRSFAGKVSEELEAICLGFGEQTALACTDAYAWPDDLLCFPAARGTEWVGAPGHQ